MAYMYGADELPKNKVNHAPGTVNGDLTAEEWNDTVDAIDEIRSAIQADAKYIGLAAQTSPPLSADAKARLAMKGNDLIISISGRAYRSLLPRFVDVTEFTQALSPGADCTAAVTAAVAAAVARGVRRIHFPEGEYFFDALESEGPGGGANSYRVLIPSNFQVTGEGWGRSVLWHVNTTTGDGEYGTGADDLFRCADGTHHVKFIDLHFKGENGDNDGNGFEHPFQNQNSFISSLLINSSDIQTLNCYFQNGFGFSVHDPGENERVSVVGCTTRWMANGVNVCSNWSLQLGCTFINSEGIEASGKHIVLANNTFQDAIGVAISAGGNVGDAGLYPGGIVCNNTIDGSTACGIVIADNFGDATVSYNVVRECAAGGIICPEADAGRSPRRITFMGNVLVDNCGSGSSSIVGIDIRGDAASGGGYHTIVGNVSMNVGTIGYEQKYAMSLSAPNCTIDMNILSGTLKDFSATPDATGIMWGRNICINRLVEWQSGSSWDPNKTVVPSFTTVIEQYRVSEGSDGTDYYPFLRTVGGRIEWGRRDTPAVRDVFLDYDDVTPGQLKFTGKIRVEELVAFGAADANWTKGTTVEAPSYYKDLTGRCWVQGKMTAGASPTNALFPAGRLPASRRPVATHTPRAQCQYQAVADSRFYSATVEFAPDGSVSAIPGGPSGTWATGDILYLDGASFIIGA